jgi:GNAT superfamily N-acetyltransferase
MIRKSIAKDSPYIAALHYQNISQGFLSKLGIDFLQMLYIFLIQKELVLVYEKENKIIGFVSCAISSKSIMKRFLFSNPSGIIKILFAVIRNPKLVKPLFETYHAPSLSVSSGFEYKIMPETELLSVSVSKEVQKEGIGAQLLAGLEEELKKMEIKQYKVIAGEKLVGANKFYLKNGFALAKQICIHGKDNSNVYIKHLVHV